MKYTGKSESDEILKSTRLKGKPTIEIVPLRPAVKSDEETELTVLVRVVPPVVDATPTQRPALNVGLVLDRSGSMSGSKMKAVKAAASYAVSQLAPTDRLSVTIYDDVVETIVPSTRVENKASLLAAINRIEVNGWTDLHGGWLEGATQVSSHLDPSRLNRVLLLTDGLANHGETNPARICEHVRGLSQRGVSTSTFGVGTDFNEDLLQAMQEAGDGSYYFIEGPGDLERIFASEFQGLMSTIGQKVSLGVEPGLDNKGVALVDVLNDLPRASTGRLMLPNLVADNPVEIVLTLSVPPQSGEKDVCYLRLAWDEPGNAGRQTIREALCLPAVPARERETLPEDADVKRQTALLTATRIRQQAVDHLDQGNMAGAQEMLVAMKSQMASVMAAAPAAFARELQEELDEAGELEKRLEAGEVSAATKIAKFKNFRARRSQR